MRVASNRACVGCSIRSTRSHPCPSACPQYYDLTPTSVFPPGTFDLPNITCIDGDVRDLHKHAPVGMPELFRRWD